MRKIQKMKKIESNFKIKKYCELLLSKFKNKNPISPLDLLLSRTLVNGFLLLNLIFKGAYLNLK